MRFRSPRIAIRPIIVSPMLWNVAAALLVGCGCLSAAPPRVLVDDYSLEQVAREPDIVTPVALAVDTAGRLLVVESHTHKRTEDYQGPTTDRIRALDDSDGDGKLDRWAEVADGFRHAMNVVVRNDGAIVVVTRGDVFLLEADEQGGFGKPATLVHLETKIDYPHNALGGFVFDGRGGFYLGLGENFGGAYRLIGSDGAEFADSGGTGMIFHFANDGSGMKRIAQGFWNPFGLGIAGRKTLFAVDNDPDASPPCRLIHVVETGDYGHRWEYGRAGVHPLQAWNGELPGTLPMVCGTGEAPCAVVPHENHLWVTSWGDHRVERYKLTSSAGTFAGQREVVVQGDADFRPTGFAVASSGDIYFADWVSKSYPVHGKGRIWRLSRKEAYEPEPWEVIESREAPIGKQSPEQLTNSPQPFERQRTVARYVAEQSTKGIDLADARTDSERLVRLQAIRWSEQAVEDDLLRAELQHPSADIRLYALRWICDQHRTPLRNDVAELLKREIPSERYYLALLGAIAWLDGDRKPPPKSIVDGLLARELRNKNRAPEIKALALRLISPNHKQLTLDVLNGYIEGNSAELRREAIQALALCQHENRFVYLAKVAGDETLDPSLRADALAGLAGEVAQFEPLIRKLAESDLPALRSEASRILRLTSRDQEALATQPPEIKPEPTDLDTWLALTEGRGDAESGRRLFFSSVGPRCGTCHNRNGCGGSFGPALTGYGNNHSRRQILTAILQPSRDIAPRYVPWVLETDDGKTHVGLRLPQGGDNGNEPYIDSEGKRFDLQSDNVEFRQPAKKSIMPEGIEKTISVEDLADLLAYLSEASGE